MRLSRQAILHLRRPRHLASSQPPLPSAASLCAKPIFDPPPNAAAPARCSRLPRPRLDVRGRHASSHLSHDRHHSASSHRNHNRYNSRCYRRPATCCRLPAADATATTSSVLAIAAATSSAPPHRQPLPLPPRVFPRLPPTPSPSSPTADHRRALGAPTTTPCRPLQWPTALPRRAPPAAVQAPSPACHRIVAARIVAAASSRRCWRVIAS